MTHSDSNTQTRDRQKPPGGRLGLTAAVPVDLIAQASGTALKVWCALARRMDYRSLDCFPSQSRLAVDAGLSRRAVQRGLVELERLGRLKRKRRGRTSNSYTLIFLCDINGASECDKNGASECAANGVTECASDGALTRALNRDSFDESKPVRGCTEPRKPASPRHRHGNKISPEHALERLPEGLRRYEAAVSDWLIYKHERRQDYTTMGLKKLFEAMAAMGGNLPASVDKCIANNWAGLFETNASSNAGAIPDDQTRYANGKALPARWGAA